MFKVKEIRTGLELRGLKICVQKKKNGKKHHKTEGDM